MFSSFLLSNIQCPNLELTGFCELGPLCPFSHPPTAQKVQSVSHLPDNDSVSEDVKELLSEALFEEHYVTVQSTGSSFHQVSRTSNESPVNSNS